MFDLARITSHSVPRKRLAAAAAVSAALLAVAVPGTGHAQEGGNDEVTLCHASSDGTYETITVSESAAENGHGNHEDDIIPAPDGGCPTDNPPPEPPSGDGSGDGAGDGSGGTPSGGTPSANDKVVICHLTSSGDYTVIDIADEGWENGHAAHEGDILIGDGAGTDSCPAAQAALAAVAAGTAGVAGVNVDALVAGDPDLPVAGVEHTLMLTVAAIALLSGLWLVRVSRVRLPS